MCFLGFVGVVLYAFEIRYRKRQKGVAGEESVDERGLSTDSRKEAGFNSGVEDGVVMENGTPAGAVSGKPHERKIEKPVDSENGEAEECCGLHLVCEKNSLSPVDDNIIYYDDEELDRFRGRSSESYGSEEVEEFRDVLMTLRPEDVPGWARSITQRRLELPSEVRDELLILINEQRAKGANRT